MRVVVVVVLFEITRKEIMIICFLLRLRLCSVFHSTFIFCSIRMNKSKTCSYTLLCLGWKPCTYWVFDICISTMSVSISRIVWPISFVPDFRLFAGIISTQFNSVYTRRLFISTKEKTFNLHAVVFSLSLDCDLCTKLDVLRRSRSNEWISEHLRMFNEKSTFTLPPCSTIVI